VKQTPALGIEEYYGVVPSGMTDVQLLTQIAESSWPTIPPVGTLTVIDDIVYWQLDPAANFLHNTEVSVKITTEVATPGGATLNEQIEYFFTTEYCPLYIGPDLLRIELGGLSTLNDDTLCRIIHKNSIEAWELSNRGIPLKNPPFRIRQWVKCKSILDILGVLVLARDLREGQTKTLGDLTIRQQPSDPTLGAKYSQAEKCIDDLALFDDEDQLATVAVKGSASGVERHDFRMRTWDYLLLQAEPAANLQGERWEKQRHSVNYAFAGKDVRFAQRFFVRAVPSKASI
jgi:hypothetical protein